MNPVISVPLIESGFTRKHIKNLLSTNLYDDFIQYPLSWEGINDAIKYKKSSYTQRQTLVQSLKKQYEDAGIDIKNSITLSQIETLLDKNTFTITTGQQIHILLGPEFFINKIIDCIELAKLANNTIASYHIVPIFWMATEDHDFDEINYIEIYNTKYHWASSQQGAVGRFNTHGLKELIINVFDRLDKTQNHENLKHIFINLLTDTDTLSTYSRKILHHLFGMDGLVIIDADSIELKSLFADIMYDELEHQTCKSIVSETNIKLKKLEFKNIINPKTYNLFELKNNARNRINSYNSEISAEHLSPNVLMRPLYQETILPNIMYIAGPSEIEYWLQLKSYFNHYQIPMPVLRPRDLIFRTHFSKLAKSQIELKNLLKSKQVLEEAINNNGSKVVNLSHSISKLIKDLKTEIQISTHFKDIDLEAINIDFNTLHDQILNKQEALLDTFLEIKLYKQWIVNNPEKKYFNIQNAISLFSIPITLEPKHFLMWY